MLDKVNLLILFGGVSSEHEVSCKSAASILKHINKEKYNITTVGITKEGTWYQTEASFDEIQDGRWLYSETNQKGNLSITRTPRGFVLDSGKVIDIDCVFPTTHGKYGEDGCLQGALELAGIKYVGPNVLSSSICMDKVIAKIVASETDVLQAKYYATDRYKFSSNPIGIIEEIEKHFNKNYPLFIKPANAGSSVGITKANNDRELFEGLRIAAENDHKMLVEETIVGREFEVAVLGNRKPRASKIGEILSANEFYDYDAKYENISSETRIVNDISQEEEKFIQESAIKLYSAFSCKGLSRVDFFFTEDRRLVFNEINTLPGFTNISMYPKLWEESGVLYDELIDRLIELAMEE